MFSDDTPVTLGDLTFATTMLTLEIVTALSPIHEIEQRLQEIGGALLNVSNATTDPGRKRVLYAMAHGLISTEDS